MGIERRDQRRRTDIRFLNSINNATLVVLHTTPKTAKPELVKRKIEYWVNYFSRIPYPETLVKRSKKTAHKPSKKKVGQLMKKVSKQLNENTNARKTNVRKVNKNRVQSK